MHNDDDDDVSEITDMAVKRVDAVANPAHGTRFLLLKTRAPQAAAVKASREIPASGPGEAASILAAVTGERGTARNCAARTADGSPCQRPAVDGGYCHHHVAKEGGKVTVKKVAKDPIKALHRLEKAALQLPARHPARVHAAQLVLFHKMRMTHAGSVAKAVGSITSDQAAAIAAATREVVAAATGSQGQDLLPKPASAAAQLAAARDGTYEPQRLGAQNPDVASIYTSPAASLGQIQKAGERRLEAAEQAFAKARAEGSGAEIARAGEEVTLARLSLFHAAMGR